jgi:PAS domain S-box-containing protein
MRWMGAGAVTLWLALGVPEAQADGFLPHAVCYLWDRSLLAVHATSDFLIGVSYVTISATLAYLVYRARRDIPFHSILLAFGAFIVACGATHFMELWTLWEPRYWLAGAVKIVTAGASLATALVLPPLVPKALALVRASQLLNEQARIVRLSESRFRALLESAPDGIIITDRDGRISIVNRQAEVLFGYEREDLIGRSIEVLLPERARDGHAAHRAKYLAAPAVRPMGRGLALSGRRNDGSEFPAEISLSPLETEEGLLITAVVRDVTERRLAEAQHLELVRAQAARAEAETANRAKDQFLATLSHELRTPLNSVCGWAKLLRAGTLDSATAARGLEVIERNSRAQGQMIDDLLDVSRITAGKLELDMRLVDAHGVMEAALDVVAPAAAAKSLRVESALDRHAGTIVGDAERLQQVVWNLLSNSVKFTPRGGRIDVRLRRAGSHVEIEVADTGEGIAPSVLPFIFDRYRQGARGRRGGLGIGLSLVRHLVQLHGGEVHAHSNGPGLGAVFLVRLPATTAEFAEPDTPATMPTSEPPVPHRPLSGLRLLVVEDDQDSLEFFRTLLGGQGAAVATATSAKDALASIARELPDVVLSDIEMPDGDGYELVRALRAAPYARRRDLPIVAVTAYGRLEDRIRLLSAGFNMHLTKPVDPSELVAVILNLARRAPGDGAG